MPVLLTKTALTILNLTHQKQPDNSQNNQNRKKILMEEPKKIRREPEKNKMFIKLGSGGGIGAVVLLAGALATTAVASAFIFGRNKRKSGKNNQHHQLSPPPKVVSHESLGHDNPSIETTNMDEAENDTDLFVSTESTIVLPKLEINGGKGNAGYSDEETLCYNSPKNLENGTISLDRFSVPILDENLLFKPESAKNNQDQPVNVEDKQVEEDPMDDEEEESSAVKCEAIETIDADQTEQELQLIEGKTDTCCDREENDGVHSNEIIKEKYNQQIQVNIEENREKKTDIYVTQEPVSTDFSKTERVASENYGDDGQILQPAVENLLVVENNTANDDKKEDLQVKLNAAEEISCDNDEETVCIDTTMPANIQCRDYDDHVEMFNGSSHFSSEVVIDDNPKEELLFAEEIAASGEDENWDLKEQLLDFQQKEYESDSEENGEEIEVAFVTIRGEDEEKVDDIEDGSRDDPKEELLFAENQDVIEDNPLMQLLDFQQKEYESDPEENDGEEIEVAFETIRGEDEDEEKIDDIEDESDEKLDENLEGTGDFSVESNVNFNGANLDYHEMEGKIEEDKAAREGKYNLNEYNIQRSSEKSSIDKYILELGTQNNQTRKRILIGTVSVVSWISCYWFFGLSFFKLGLIVFFTMVLSKIPCY